MFSVYRIQTIYLVGVSALGERKAKNWVKWAQPCCSYFLPILAKNCFYFVLIFAVALFKTCITFFANYYCES